MATTAVIPTPVVSGTAVPERIPRPAVSGTAAPELILTCVVSGTAAVTGIKLPVISFNHFRTADVVPLPAVRLGAVYIAGSGGMTFGGGAVIVGDPYTASGGMLFGGAAVVSFSTLTTLEIVGDGGIEYGGEAVVQEAIAYVPSGGIAFGGSAVVQEQINFIASGGVVLGGTDPVVVVYTVTAGGGMLLGGAAPNSVAYHETASGGIAFGGAAVVSFYSAFHLASGGMAFGGTGNGFVLPVGFVVTPENPYNDDFPGWAMNAKTGAASRYERLPANSMCRFMGKTYVSNAAGIYRLGAADDAGQPIRAWVDVPLTDYGTENSKRVPDIYLGVRTAGRMKLAAGTNYKGRKYYSVPRIQSKVTAARVQVGQGIEGRYWSIGFGNIEGAAFDYESLVLKPRILSRPGK